MDNGLKFLYNTAPGRSILKLLTRRGLSTAVGRFMDSSLSRPLIRTFVKNNNIDLEECESQDFRCFNDCFTRRLKQELRPVDMDPMHLISPCDGLLSVYDIDEDMVLPVKQSQYSLNDLFENEEVSAYFYGGTCLVFRLCVNHYHRYCYPLDGKKGENFFIPGVLHTVRPIALSKEPVFIRNCREYTIMENDIFGRAAQIEVGAMLVGKIHNNDGVADIRRGYEKGYFCYGGSTIILLLEPGAVRISEEILDANRRGEEYPVKLGQSIGERV